MCKVTKILSKKQLQILPRPTLTIKHAPTTHYYPTPAATATKFFCLSWERRRLAVGTRDAKPFDATTPSPKKNLGPSGSVALRLGSLYYYYECVVIVKVIVV